MNRYRYPSCRLLAAAVLSWAATSIAAAADTAPTQQELQQAEAPSLSRGQTQVQSRFVRDFSAFAGSDENAQSLYEGLRNGTRITLGSSAGDGGTPTLVEFDPPTGSMGNGSAYISLALAKQQLANHGITDPTPEQIQAALTGGTILPAGPDAQPIELQGILAQRADGMGWGSIAKASGMRLGSVVSGMRRSSAAATAGGTGSSGITTAGGATVQSSRATTGAGGQGSTNRGQSASASSRGMVTAAGGAVSAGARSNASLRSGGHAYGSTGLVTGNGSVAGQVRAGSAQGQGKGLLKH